MSLKEPAFFSPAVNEIRNELRDLGYTPVHMGTARSYDGSYDSSFVIDMDAFAHVCVELQKTRKALQAEREKKWWKFRK